VTSAEAKRILIAYRPGHATPDADVLAALAEVRRNSELAQWWQQQQSFHVAMSRGFADAPVPGGGRAAIMARSRLITFPWWRQPRVWAAAAVVALLLGVGTVMLWPKEKAGSLATFRSRMVRTVLRQYRMDIQTNDMAVIRQFLATNGAPADYVLPPGLAQLPVSGAGVLSWRDARVSMICLDAGVQGLLFLFVTDGTKVDKPSNPQEFASVNKLMTVSWTKAEKVYVLASFGGRETLGKYLPPNAELRD
jgi:hypothetical protein